MTSTADVPAEPAPGWAAAQMHGVSRDSSTFNQFAGNQIINSPSSRGERGFLPGWGDESAAVSVAPRLPLHLQDQRLSLWGRNELVQELVTLLDRPGTGPRVHLLYGLGGCGKTSIAQQVAYEATRLRVPVDIWWVSADDSMLVAGMRIVAHLVGASDEDLLYGAADALWRRLARHPKPWLLVVDGADDPSLLTVDGQESFAAGTGWVRPLPNSRGLVLVTTRAGSHEMWGSGEWTHRHHVGMLERHDAARVLLDYAGGVAGTRAEAEDLADRLGRLPLALSHAGAFLAENADRWDSDDIATFFEYRRALDSGRLDMFPGTDGGILTDRRSRQIITRTWEMSLDLLDRQGMPQARALLRLLSHSADAPVPYKLLLHPATLATFEPFSGVNGAGLRRLLKALAGLRLLELPSVQNTDEAGRRLPVLRIHPLVRDTNRHHCKESDESTVYLTMSAALTDRAAHDSGDPTDPATWPAWHTLAPHCAYILGAIDTQRERPDVSTEAVGQAAYAAHHAARYLHARGLYAQAEAELRYVSDALCRLPGDNASAILDNRHWLAGTLRERGELAEAELEFRAVYEARRRLFDGIRPDTGGILAELARVGWHTPEGLTLLERHGAAYAVQPVLDMLDTYTELAITLGYQRRSAEAKEIYRAVYEACRRILGEAHVHTLNSRAGLAVRLYEDGELEAAEREFRAIREGERELLGDNHPNTLVTRSSLARVLSERGQLGEAEMEFRAVYETCLRVLEYEHPETLRCRRELASVLHARGQRLVDEYEQRYRLDAEGSAGMPEAGDVQEKAGRLERAMAAFDEARALVNRESDPTFYAVLSHDIGNVHRAAGRLAEAAEAYQESADCEGLAGRWREQATALLLVGQIRRDLNQPEDALAAATRAQQVLRTMPEPPARNLAEALVLAGDALRTDQPAQALPHLQEARQLLAVDGVGAPLEQLAVLERIRAAHIALNATADAQTVLKDAEVILTRYAADVLSGSDVDAVLDLISALVQHEQLTQAQTALERAEALLSAETGATVGRRAELSHTLGRRYEALGDRGEAWAYAGARVAYLNTLGLIAPENDPGVYGTVLYDLADVHKAEGNLDEAADAYQASAKYKGLAGNLNGQASALRRVGEIHFELGIRERSKLPDLKADDD